MTKLILITIGTNQSLGSTNRIVLGSTSLMGPTNK
jgi:hypothetical protein